MTRKKVTAEPVLKSWDNVKESSKELATCEFELQKMTAKKNEEVGRIESKYDEQAEPHLQRKIRLEKDIQEFSEFHVEQFDKEKTKDFGYLKLGFRKSSPLKTISKWTWAKVLAKLKEIGRKEFIRNKEEVNKEAVKSANLGEDVLNTFGCTMKEENKFWYEINQKAISADANILEMQRKAS